MNFGRELNEEEKNQICVCENCSCKGFLKHFEKCPKCNSESYHKTIRIRENSEQSLPESKLQQ